MLRARARWSPEALRRIRAPDALHPRWSRLASTVPRRGGALDGGALNARARSRGAPSARLVRSLIHIYEAKGPLSIL